MNGDSKFLLGERVHLVGDVDKNGKIIGYLHRLNGQMLCGYESEAGDIWLSPESNLRLYKSISWTGSPTTLQK